MSRVYLDHNATAPLRPEARRAMERALDLAQANASSLHAEGRAARRIVEEARVEVAALAGVAPKEVVFTSSGSEAIAAAIAGATARTDPRRRRLLVPSTEHSAVLAAARAAARHGFEVVAITPDTEGRIEPRTIAAHLDDEVALVALHAANNETGVIQPVAEVGALAESAGAVFVVDAVQAAGKLSIDRDAWGADLVALSAHKLGGPQGGGALIVRDGLPMEPLIGGGAQERRRRAGTEAVAAIAGFGAASASARGDLDGEGRRLRGLREKLEVGLKGIHPKLRIHGGAAERLPNTSNVAIPGLSGETLMIALDLAGFAVSTGSACTSGAIEPSHVLMAMGRTEAEAKEAIRISTGWSTTDAEIEALLAAMPAILERATMRRP